MKSDKEQTCSRCRKPIAAGEQHTIVLRTEPVYGRIGYPSYELTWFVKAGPDLHYHDGCRPTHAAAPGKSQ